MKLKFGAFVNYTPSTALTMVPNGVEMSAEKEKDEIK